MHNNIEWGRWVKLCLFMGGPIYGPDFCKFCLFANRFWHKFFTGRSPTLIK